MARFGFTMAVLAVGAVATTIGSPATAGKHHGKRNVAPITGERVRNAQAYAPPALNIAPDRGYFDEALSPPAGR